MEDNSYDENSSGTEEEVHVEADPAYKTDSQDDISSLTQQPSPGQDVQESNHYSPIEDPIPDTSIQPNELIIIPSRKILRGKDKHKWSSAKPSSRSRASRNIVHITPGPTRTCENELDPLRCFSSFITGGMIDLIVTHTNAEIEMKTEKYKKVQATQKLTDENEIRALIGILTLSAAMKDNHLPSRELFDINFCGNRYRRSNERFEFLINCLRFDDMSTRQQRRQADVFAPFRDFWDLFVTACQENYKPSCNLTIGEQFLGFRGRCPFRIYIPNKPSKYGFKIVMLVVILQSIW